MPGEYFEACKTQGFEKVTALHLNWIWKYFKDPQPPLDADIDVNAIESTLIWKERKWDAKSEMKEEEKEKIDLWKQNDWLEHNSYTLWNRNSVMDIQGKSFVMLYKFWADLTGQSQKGEDLLKKVKQAGVKEIIDIKISS